MNAVPKKIISSVSAVLITIIIYYGSYLPYQKSQNFIRALQTRVSSVQDFFDTFSVPLDDASPIGQEELVRNVGSSVLGIIQNSGGNKDLVKAVIDYLDGYYIPIVGVDRGLNFGQDLFILGSINETAFEKTGDPIYLQKAKDYYLRGIKHGPKRPQFLYGLFGIYYREGNIAEATKIGQQILSQWPTDDKMENTLKAFAALPSSSPSTK